MSKAKKGKHNPDIQPEEVLEHLANILGCLREARDNEFLIGCGYSEGIRSVDASITMDEVKERLANIMAKNKQTFSSQYRHSVDGLHAFVYQILGSTVELNYRIFKRMEVKQT